MAIARAAVVEFAVRQGFDDRLADVRLAVSEIVTNSIVHAYRDGEGGSIHIDAEVNGHLQIVIRDTGGGLAPRPDSPGLGMGLAIAAQTADEMQVSSIPGGGSEIVLTFR